MRGRRRAIEELCMPDRPRSAIEAMYPAPIHDSFFTIHKLQAPIGIWYREGRVDGLIAINDDSTRGNGATACIATPAHKHGTRCRSCVEGHHGSLFEVTGTGCSAVDAERCGGDGAAAYTLLLHCDREDRNQHDF